MRQTDYRGSRPSAYAHFVKILGSLTVEMFSLTVLRQAPLEQYFLKDFSLKFL
jgi:hypothetical protein